MELVFLINQFIALAKIPGSIEFYISVTLLSIICLFAFYNLWKYTLKPKPYFLPKGQITEEPIIQMFLQEALDQNTYFEIQIATEGSARRPTLRCSLKHLSSNGITIEINGVKTLQSSWVNLPVNAYFRIKEPHGGQSHFMFSSSIQSVYVTRSNVYLLTLAIPKTLDSRQKRSSLRINPPRHAVAGAAFWYGKNMPKIEEMSDISLWQNPLLFYIKDKVSQFDINDISTGGIRLSFPRNILQLHDLHISSVDHFLVMLDLIQPGARSLLRIWLHCRTQSVTAIPESSNVIVGAQFLAWGKPCINSQGKAGGIDWLKISSTREVDSLSKWITQHHIEQVRAAQSDEKTSEITTA